MAGPNRGEAKNPEFYIHLFDPLLLSFLFFLNSNLLCLAGHYNRQPLSWWNIQLPFLPPYTKRMVILLHHITINFVQLFCITDFFSRLRAISSQSLFLSRRCGAFDSHKAELFF